MSNSSRATSGTDNIRRKIAWRILPFVFVLYIIAYLDRANVAFAKMPMSAELAFSEAVFGLGAGIFYVGYILLEIPGALIVERWSAKIWMSRIMITWGLCMAWVTTLAGIQAPHGDGGEQGYFVKIPSKFTSHDGQSAWLCL